MATEIKGQFNIQNFYHCFKNHLKRCIIIVFSFQSPKDLNTAIFRTVPVEEQCKETTERLQSYLLFTIRKPSHECNND